MNKLPQFTILLLHLILRGVVPSSRFKEQSKHPNKSSHSFVVFSNIVKIRFRMPLAFPSRNYNSNL